MRNNTNTPATSLDGLHVQLVDPVTGEQHKTWLASALAGNVSYSSSPKVTGTDTGLEGQIHVITEDGTPTGAVVSTQVYDETSNTWFTIGAPDTRIDVNLTPITYVPTATGNTQNLGQLVIDPNGHVWAIDQQGDAVQLTLDDTVTTLILAAGIIGPTVATYTSEDGTVTNIPGLNVLTTVQPTPTATGNTTNLNSVFKDATGTTWIVDAAGDAVMAGAAVFKELNRWYVDPNGSNTTGTGANENPYLTIAAAYAAAGQGDTVVVNEGVYAETVTLSTQNTTLAGASGAYGSLTQIAGVNATAAGTSVRVADLTVTGAVAHTGTAPLYLNNVTVGGAFTASSNVYREIRDSSLQDGGITVTAGTTLIEDSKVGTSSFTGAGTVVALRNVTVDPGECITIGAGVVYSLADVTGCVIIDPAAIPAETAALAAGLPAALAEAVATTSFNNLRVVDPDYEAAPTQFVTRDPVTGELEYSNAPVSGAPVTVSDQSPTGTAIEGAIHLVTDDGTPTGTVLEQYIYDTDSATWIEMNRNAKSLLKFGTTAPTGSGDWDGEEFFVTSDGTSTGEVLEQWIYDYQSDTWVKRPDPELRTTSITPVVYNGSAYVSAQADVETNLADLIQLSDGTRIHDGKVTWTGHGYEVGKWYYLSQTTAGAVISTQPTSGWVQQLFFVEDANTLHVDIEEGWNYTNSANVKAGVFATFQQNQSVATNTVTNLTNMTTVRNTAGSNWNAAAGTFTAPRSGWYDVSANMFYNAGNWNAGGQEQLLFTVNGAYRVSNYVMVETALTNFYPDSIQTHAKLYLNAGDVLRPQAYQNSGSAKTIGSALYNTFSIVEIG